jgi:3-hydroxyacyl-CoA dehydrogenase
MASEQFDTVALVGAGVIGRGWIRVLAPRCQVRLYNPDPAQSAAAMRWLEQDLVTTATKAKFRRAMRL